MCLHDAGNGVRATDLVNSYPSALHVGASWDKNLTYQRGLYMGKEFKAKGGEFLSPHGDECILIPYLK
jgi:beta-glucosidase